MIFALPFRTLLAKETKRIFSIWIQTILTPIMTTGLYLFIFGISLGSQIRVNNTGISYLSFIVPGLVGMSIVNNAAMNSWGSIFLGKINGYLNDILIAPLSYIELALGYVLPGALRGLLIGTVVWLISLAFGGPMPVHPIFAFAIASLTAIFFSCAGIFVAIWAKDFDQMGAFNTFILLPLVYLGGVFYSLQVLPETWRNVSRLNPILYMVDGLRYGFLGVSDVNPWHAILFIAAIAAIGVAVVTWIFKTGWKLKS